MKIHYPQREKETFWIHGTPFNRVDVEKGVFQRENMEYLTGEYKVFLYGDLLDGVSTLDVNLECLDLKNCDIPIVKENFLKGFFKFKPQLREEHSENNLVIQFNFLKQDELEIYKFKGRPKRLVDKRQP